MTPEIFELAAEELQIRTRWSLLQAQGTLRLALKAGGVRPETVTPRELRAVVEKVMPEQLEIRGVDDPDSVCAAVLQRVGHVGSFSRPATDLDEVFQRLGGD